MHIKHSPIVLTLTSLITAAALAEEPHIVYVDDDGPRIRTSELGSLHNPYASIKQAVQASQFLLGDVEIRICDGVYAPDGARVGSDTTIDGSYKRVVVGGQILLMHSDTPGFSRALLDGSLADPDDDKPFFIVDGERDVFIKNLRMTNGKGEGVHGKAITVVNSTQVFIDHCKFANNTSSEGMGAVHFEESGAYIYDCSFTNNGSFGTDPHLTPSYGAVTVISVQNGFTLIQDSQFENNRSTSGSAIYTHQYTGNAIEITRCSFERNIGYHNGAIYSQGDDTAHTKITSCLFAHNTAYSGHGGALEVNSGNTLLANVTMTENYADEGAAVHYDGHNANVTIGASILWYNSGVQIISHTGPTNHSVADSIVSHGVDLGEHSGAIYHTDPRFVNPSAGNYRLAHDSPAIDSGDIRHILATLSPPTAGSRWNDLDKNPRVFDSPDHPNLTAQPVDMGCYERNEDEGAHLLMCSPADVAAPLGVLDITDVLEFLTSYGSGCP